MFAKPTYDENGELSDGGADLSMKGLCEYCFDIHYVSAFVQITSAFVSSWFFLVRWHHKETNFSKIWLIVLAFVLYKLWINFGAPFFFQEPDEVRNFCIIFPYVSQTKGESNTQKKRREREEKAGGNVKYKFSRR